MVICNTKDANSIDFLCDLGIIVMEQKYLEGGIKMAVSSIRLDDHVKKETARIADKLGMSVNSVIEILLRKFIRDKGFVEPLRLDDELEKPYLDMSPREMELDLQRAVHNRSVEDQDAFETLFDDTGRMYRRYDDGRVEYVLD